MQEKPWCCTDADTTVGSTVCAVLLLPGFNWLPFRLALLLFEMLHCFQGRLFVTNGDQIHAACRALPVSSRLGKLG